MDLSIPSFVKFEGVVVSQRLSAVSLHRTAAVLTVVDKTDSAVNKRVVSVLAVAKSSRDRLL
jgi:hypothetical protein